MTVNAVTKSFGSHLGSYVYSLDQPRLIEALYKGSPWTLGALGIGYTAYNTVTAVNDNHKKAFIKTALVSAGAIAAAIVTTRYLGGRPENVEKSLAEAVHMVKHVLEKAPISPTLEALLGEAQHKILSPRKVHRLREELYKAAPTLHEKLLNLIIPSPEEELNAVKKAEWKEKFLKFNPNLNKKFLEDLFKVDHEDPFWKELLKLSALGIAPVAGGIAGGVAGNMINHEDWQEKFKVQLKEGSYQLLSNILICNIGAAMFGGALHLAWKDAPRHVRLPVMLSGIGIIGVYAGSAIANALGKLFINDACDHGCSYAYQKTRERYHQEGWKGLTNNLYAERRPEIWDVLTHLDDLVMVGALAGLQWVLPGLAFLYSFSGIRAGIGYRNGHQRLADDNEPPEHGHPHNLTAVNDKTLPATGNMLSAIRNVKKPAPENLAAFANSSIQNAYSPAYNPFINYPAPVAI